MHVSRGRQLVLFLPVCFRASQHKTSPQLVLIWLAIFLALVFNCFITGTLKEPKFLQDVVTIFSPIPVPLKLVAVRHCIISTSKNTIALKTVSWSTSAV